MLLLEPTDPRYNVVKILGQGASATVYLAKHLALGELRVLKILHHDMMMDAKRRAKFMLEAQVSAHLKHPGIVQVFDVTQSTSKLQIEMEHIDGLSLRQHLEKRLEFPLSIALALVYGILEGLEHAHRAKLTLGETDFDGVIHRDLKPENIMIRKNGQPVICDFGVAKVGADLMTMTQHISGSVAYMAPERLRGEPSKRSIDIFALGVMFFELHKGYRPFSGNNKTQVIENILNWNIRDLDFEWRGSDSKILDVIRQALARDPSQRFQDASQMLHSLRPIFRQYHGDMPAAQVVQDYLTRGHFTTAEIRSLAPTTNPWKNWIPIAISASALAAVAFLIFLAWPKQEVAIPSGSADLTLEELVGANRFEDAETKIAQLPKPERQLAYFNLAKYCLHVKEDASNALLLVTKALDISFHPTIALLKSQVLVDQAIYKAAESEMARIEPFVPKLNRENQAQYHWLLAKLQLSKSPDSTGKARTIARASLLKYIELKPNGEAENLKKATQLLISLQ